MDFETTLKATLFFFFYSSSFCRAMMRGRAGNLFSNVLKRILINLVTQTKCFLSPSLRRRERGGETARTSEKTLSLSLSLTLCSYPRARFVVCLAREDETTETAEMRERLLNENFLSTRQTNTNCI